MAPIGNAVFATLLLNDAYLPGAMVLAHSLRDRGAKGRLVCFVVVDKLSDSTFTELKTVYHEIIPVPQIVNKTPANLYLMNRPDLVSTFTKIQLWKQTQFKRIVYLDADMVALRAPNELLTMDTNFAAVPDIGWPDCFNSGLLVLNPNLAEYYGLLALAERGISFDGADQGLLNMHFRDWERLSFVYNCTPSGNYQYLPAYRHFQASISMVHFIGKEKPWTMGRHNKHTSGVYSELLGRWWAVYDRHYRSQGTQYYSGTYQQSPRKVQDYVLGEETIYIPEYQRPVAQEAAPLPKHVENSTKDLAPVIEQPLGDQPAIEEQIEKNEFTPTPTVTQRRFSAPHAEWEPSRAPPPTNSKPEAANFPSTVYEMSASKELFRPPASYPEPPKDMWYEVPRKVEPSPKPKPIFPWEEHAPKPTRVFVEPKLPSPPPEPEYESEEDLVSEGASSSAGTTIATGSTTTPNDPPKEPYVDPWTTFNQRSNAWDDMPEITRYMQALNQPKKGRIQVLHHTPSTRSGPSTSADAGRRDSLRVTDFPTEIERPSLPVTPAPIRRPTFWGEDRDEVGDLPVAEGVPKQAEWVRRFSSYPEPAFNAPSPIMKVVNDVICFKCQYCGKQNPITRLEELQRRQSEALAGIEIGNIQDLPKREMPESESKEAVVQAAEKASLPPPKMPLRPILKEPSFEIEPKESKSEESIDPMNNTKDVSNISTVSDTSSRSGPEPISSNTATETTSGSVTSQDTLEKADQ